MVGVNTTALLALSYAKRKSIDMNNCNSDTNDAYVMYDCLTRFMALVDLYSLKSLQVLQSFMEQNTSSSEQQAFYDAALAEVNRQINERTEAQCKI